MLLKNDRLRKTFAILFACGLFAFLTVIPASARIAGVERVVEKSVWSHADEDEDDDKGEIIIILQPPLPPSGVDG